MKIAIITLISFIFLFSGCTEEVYVYEVIDGDTFTIYDGNSIRLIGIDAPEKDEPYYSEAKERLAELLEHKTVTLKKDKEDKDSYGRLLRYIYADDVFVNLKLVEEGYAIALTIPPNLKHESELKRAEYEARESKLGMWSSSS